MPVSLGESIDATAGLPQPNEARIAVWMDGSGVRVGCYVGAKVYKKQASVLLPTAQMVRHHCNSSNNSDHLHILGIKDQQSLQPKDIKMQLSTIFLVALTSALVSAAPSTTNLGERDSCVKSTACEPRMGHNSWWQ